MILTDTNVLSEAMRAEPAPGVVAWLDAQPADELALAAPVLAELILGAALLPNGSRKTRLQATIEFLVEARFRSRIVGFDARAAREYGRLIADARGRGQAIGIVDGQIAAIARVHRAAVATRDTTPFRVAGVPVIDPWQHPA